MTVTAELESKPRYPFYYSVDNTDPIVYPVGPNANRLSISDAAIVVPSGRHALYLWNAAVLAKSIQIPVIALCSQNSKAENAASLFDDLSVPEWYAIDIPDTYTNPLFSFKAQNHIPEHLWHAGDIAIKRNIGKALVKLALFIDDDMLIMPRDAAYAFNMLQSDNAGMIGFTQRGFPDKSRLYHGLSYRSLYIHDQTARAQAGYLSGNSLGLNTENVNVHSPHGLFDEDWAESAYVPQSKLKMVSLPSYQHHVNIVARMLNDKNSQEFGEIVGEGMVGARWNRLGRTVLREPSYWQGVIDNRLRVAQWIVTDLRNNPTVIDAAAWAALQSGSMTEPEYRALITKVAEDIYAIDSSIPLELCIDYVQALDKDHHAWQQRFRAFRKQRADKTIQQRIQALQLGQYTLHS